MRLFGFGQEPSAVEAAEQQVARAKEKRDALVTQLQDAQRELEQAKQAAISDCMELGHLDAEGSNTIASLAASVETLQQAVVKASASLEEANRAHGHEVDQAQRAE